MADEKWDEVLEDLTESFKPRLSSIDRLSLISFCADDKHIRSAVYKYLHKFKKINTKSTTLSLEKYKQGKKYFKKNKYECLSSYNASLAYAAKNDSSLFDIYNSRSLVLYQLGYKLESFQDIEMALENGNVKDSEGLIRKANTLVQLGIIKKPEDVLISPKIKEDVRKFINKKGWNAQKSLPKLKGGENEDYICASNYIDVFYNAEKGRHVKAKHDIHPGDVLFVEKPFAFVVFKDVCHNCCKSTVAPLFCEECIDVAYCSSQCRDNYQKTFHQFECGFSDFFKSIGIAHLSLKIILKASSNIHGLRKILSYIKEPYYDNGVLLYRNANYRAVYNLVNNIDKYEMIDLFQYALTALLLALYLQENTCYMEGASPEDLKFLAGTIWRHILQLVCNGHAIVDTFLKVREASSIHTETEERIGTAIYTSASMMNHSCQPSVINSFYNNVLVVRAAKQIKKGEEVYNCYGPDARRMKRGERQEILQKQYFFKCQCFTCLQQYDIQEIFTAFKCPNCLGAFILKDDNYQNYVCVACGRISKISNEIRQKEILFYSLIEEVQNITDKSVTLRLRMFVEIWRLGREIFYKFHRDLSYAADEVARCLAIMQDYRRCVLFLRCSVLSVEKRFGSFSIELAKEMKKLGDAILRYSLDHRHNIPRNTVQEGLLNYKKSERIISLLYGLDHGEVKEIRKNSHILEAGGP